MHHFTVTPRADQFAQHRRELAAGFAAARENINRAFPAQPVRRTFGPNPYG